MTDTITRMAREFADHVAYRPWEQMAKDRADLRTFTAMIAAAMGEGE